MKTDSLRKLLDKLGIWFYASIGLPMVLFGVVYLPIKDQLTWGTGDTFSVLPLWSIAIILLTFPIRYLLTLRSRVTMLNQSSREISKLNYYQNLHVRLYLLIMAASIIAVILLYVTENKLFVVVYAVLLFAISLKRPNEKSMKEELNVQ